VYSVLIQVGDSEFRQVASRDELEQAVQLAKELNAKRPQKYVVRDAEGNNVDLEE
jgi:hypothetical protein